MIVCANEWAVEFPNVALGVCVLTLTSPKITYKSFCLHSRRQGEPTFCSAQTHFWHFARVRNPFSFRNLHSCSNPHSTKQLNAIFPLLEGFWHKPPWGFFETTLAGRTRDFSHELQRLPVVLDFCRSLDADVFKFIEASSLALRPERPYRRWSLSGLEGPLLSVILATREKKGGGTLLEWIFARNDTKFTNHILSKHPLNLCLPPLPQSPLCVGSDPPHYSPCSGHSSVQKLRELKGLRAWKRVEQFY
jgi:hypothetical protein